MNGRRRNNKADYYVCDGDDRMWMLVQFPIQTVLKLPSPTKPKQLLLLWMMKAVIENKLGHLCVEQKFENSVHSERNRLILRHCIVYIMAPIYLYLYHDISTQFHSIMLPLISAVHPAFVGPPKMKEMSHLVFGQTRVYMHMKQPIHRF